MHAASATSRAVGVGACRTARAMGSARSGVGWSVCSAAFSSVHSDFGLTYLLALYAASIIADWTSASSLATPIGWWYHGSDPVCP
jgi:hypothetical protein